MVKCHKSVGAVVLEVDRVLLARLLLVPQHRLLGVLQAVLFSLHSVASGLDARVDHRVDAIEVNLGRLFLHV